MIGTKMDVVRLGLLGLLFVVAFGWMGAQVLPGAAQPGETSLWQQVAVSGGEVEVLR